jgi:hypothetical protein
MTYKTYLAVAAGILFLLGGILHGSDNGWVLYVGLAALAFAEASGAYDHHSRQDLDDREQAARLAARHAADAAAKG